MRLAYNKCHIMGKLFSGFDPRHCHIFLLTIEEVSFINSGSRSTLQGQRNGADEPGIIVWRLPVLISGKQKGDDVYN